MPKQRRWKTSSLPQAATAAEGEIAALPAQGTALRTSTAVMFFGATAADATLPVAAAGCRETPTNTTSLRQEDFPFAVQLHC